MTRLRLVRYRELVKVAESEGLHLVGRSGSHNHHCAAKAIALCHSERSEESKGHGSKHHCDIADGALRPFAPRRDSG